MVVLRASSGNIEAANLFESVLDMNARIGIYCVKGTFGGEWRTAADLLQNANIIHPFALNSVKQKYQSIIFQGKTFLPRRDLEWAMLSNFPVSLDKDAGPQRRTKSSLQPFW